MAQVDPYQIPIPQKWANDPEIGPTATYLWKFLHDLWTRTGSGVDLIANAALLTEDQTFSGDVVFSGSINLSSITLQVDGVAVVTSQQAAVADAAAATASSLSAPTNYTPHASGAVNVTSDAATDLDTTAAALNTLQAEVSVYVTEINNLLSDVSDIRNQLNDLIGKVRTHGLIAT